MRKRLKKKLMKHPRNMYARYKALNEGRQPPTPMKPPRRSSGKNWYAQYAPLFTDLIGAAREWCEYHHRLYINSMEQENNNGK